MLRHLLLSILLLAPLAALHAQSVEDIQRDPSYLWGTGNGTTLKQADDNALAALVSQISTTVSSRFEQLIDEKKENDQIATQERVSSIIRTYSGATLNNTRRIVIQNEPDAVVMRYIKADEVARIFEGRKTKLLDFVDEAVKLEQKAQVADALRYYYWAYILLQSYPDGSLLTRLDDKGEEQLLTTWIPQQMNRIFEGITLQVESVEQADNLQTIALRVTYQGKPARNYDYSYFDGRDWSNLYSAKDGRGIIELPAAARLDKLSVKTEYMFEGQANIDNELAEVMRSVTPIAMRASYQTLNLKDVTPKAETLADSLSAAAQALQTNSGMHFLTQDKTAPYQALMQRVESAIEQKDYESLRPYCTEQGYEMVRQLVAYGNTRLLRRPAYRFLEYGGEVTCRSLPLSFHFKTNRRVFVEDVVIRLNREGKINELAFGLNKPAVDDIIHQTAWGDTARMVLVNFLESYKTAYALKRLDYIRSIFSDDALIITGSVLKASGLGERAPRDKDLVKFTRHSKEEYMKKLEYIFAQNEFINLRFADNQIRESGIGGEVYGIQIRQDYYSSSYGDTGYLFLMVDLNEPKRPVIHVRTWQPEKDPNFGLIDLSFF